MKPALSFLLISSALLSIAQPRPDIDLERFAERLFQVQDADIPYEDLYESLLLCYTNPIHLNRATPDELASLYILSPLQLTSYFTYREKHGRLLSRYELQAIPGFDLETIRALLPFVTLTERTDSQPLLQSILNEDNNFLLLRYTRALERQKGYKGGEESRYLGDPNQFYGRYKISHPDDFSLGLTFEKDAGEQLTWDDATSRYGFDYYSFHFLLENKGLFKTIAVGDYQLQFGQGLVFGAGFGAGKGAETVNAVKRNSTGISPYTSAVESGFFRGTAATIRHRNAALTLFYSNLRQDANRISGAAYSDFDEFSNSIQESGYHRTHTEIGNKNRIGEQSFGGAIEYRFSPRFRIGATSLYSLFSRPLQKKPTNYNQFEFKGRRNFTGSVYGSYVWQNFIFFGEAARSRSGGAALLGGFITSLTPRIDLSFVLRDYDKDYHAFYGNAFGENPRNINEKGVYCGLKIRPIRKLELALYYDRFVFPWLKYQTEAPSDGYEYLARLTFRPSRLVRMYAQVRQQSKAITTPSESPNLHTLSDGIKRNYTFNIRYAMGKAFDFKTRIQASNYRLDGRQTKGMTFIQDLNAKFWKMKFGTRIALFDTDDYENRQYAYEKDVLYAFSFPAYYGRGIRTCLLYQYKITRKLTFYGKYARSTYQDQDTAGSGLNEISGNKRTGIKLMIRYKF